jgi:hypothetical protein
MTARLVEIRWPSGVVQTLKGVRGDQILQVDEPVEPASKQNAEP